MFTLLKSFLAMALIIFCFMLGHGNTNIQEWDKEARGLMALLVFFACIVPIWLDYLNPPKK